VPSASLTPSRNGTGRWLSVTGSDRLNPLYEPGPLHPDLG
jgi:hypothetical protein